MEKILILVVIVSVLGGANSLQCYRCVNCPTVKKDDLVTCGTNTTATTTPSTTSSSSTTSSTTISSSTTFSTTTSSSTTSSTTTASSTTPSTTTTSSTRPSTTSTTTESPIESSNSTNNSTSQNNTEPSPEAVRVRRDADDDVCLCKNGICNCNGLRIVQLSEVRAGETYVCVTDEINVNGTTVIMRGCAVKNNSTTETCVNSAFSTNCTVCETDKCNDANSKTFSFLVIFISLMFAFKLY